MCGEVTPLRPFYERNQPSRRLFPHSFPYFQVRSAGFFVREPKDEQANGLYVLGGTYYLIITTCTCRCFTDSSGRKYRCFTDSLAGKGVGVSPMENSQNNRFLWKIPGETLSGPRSGDRPASSKDPPPRRNTPHGATSRRAGLFADELELCRRDARRRRRQHEPARHRRIVQVRPRAFDFF